MERAWGKLNSAQPQRDSWQTDCFSLLGCFNDRQQTHSAGQTNHWDNPRQASAVTHWHILTVLPTGKPVILLGSSITLKNWKICPFHGTQWEGQWVIVNEWRGKKETRRDVRHRWILCDALSPASNVHAVNIPLSYLTQGWNSAFMVRWAEWVFHQQIKMKPCSRNDRNGERAAWSFMRTNLSWNAVCSLIALAYRRKCKRKG